MILPHYVKICTYILAFFIIMLLLHIVHVGGEGVGHAVKYSRSICYKEVRVYV